MAEQERWLLGGLLILVASCGDPQTTELEPAVTVRFAQPFPPATPDLSTFPGRDQGQYASEADSGQHLAVRPRSLATSHNFRTKILRREWNSLARSQPDSMAHLLADSNPFFRITLVSADSLWLSYVERSTLLDLRQPAGTHLRRYRGRYYLSSPDPDDTTQWQVRRLTLDKGRFVWESFNPDSLRLRALAPATVRLRRQAGRLFFTLSPATSPASRQVGDYGGLWLPEQ